MSKLLLVKLEYIKEFLLSKGYIWNGKIKDHFRMINRTATLEDFKSNKMARLIVLKNNKEFIQRVIVSSSQFRIENLSLKKLDNFESFNEEWITLLKSKQVIEKEILENEIKEV